MGFSVDASAPQAPAVDTTPPVVAETHEADTAADYEQKSARRRGLLSTILTNKQNRGSLAPATPAPGNTTLG